MKTSILRVLIVEDSADDFSLLLRELNKSNYEIEYTLVEDAVGFEKAISQEWDVIISDYSLPGFTGIDALKICNERELDTPFIIVSGTIGEDIAVQMMKLGAKDYIMKNSLARLLSAVEREIEDAQIRKERNQVEAALKVSEKLYHSLFENMMNGFAYCEVLFDQEQVQDFVYLEVNDAFEKLTGLKDVVGKKITEIIPGIRENDKELFKIYGQVALTGKPVTFEIYLASLKAWHSVSLYCPRKGYFVSVFDVITERKQAEKELILANEALLQSEENFHRSISESPLGIRIITVDEKTIYANKAFLDIYGFNSIEEFTSTPAINRYTPESYVQHQERKEKRKNGHEVFDYEISIVRGNTGIRYVKVWRREVLWNGTKHYQVINIDITEQKQAEQVVKVSEEKYKTILNASPDGILLTDLKGIITEVSEIGLELFDTNTRDDLVGKKIFSFIPYEEKNTIKEIIEKLRIEGELSQNIELKIRKINHSLSLSEISATLIHDPDGTPVSFMIIIRDISQRKKMESMQMHADRMSTLGEMASGIAHEIGQPLNIISMVMDKILFESYKTETIDIEFLKNKSDKIFENITRIRNIIDHIRAFSRSHDDYVLTAFDINSSIENAASMIMEQFKHLGINLNFQLKQQIPQILGNTYKFEQVILNLLVNAKDAVIEKKSKKLEYVDMIIGIRSYQENQFIIVEVTDNGIGISHDDINNIMLPFYTTKEEGKGTGLGLSICYQIIKEMNGTIDITSKKYHGTKIKIVLDIQKKK